MSGTVAVAGFLAAAVIEINGLAGTLLLLAPLAALLAVAVLLRRPPPAPAVPPELEAARAALRGERVGAAAVGILTPRAPWAEQIEAAEGRQDLTALPGLYLSFARDEIARGAADVGAGHLRSCIRAAAQCRNTGAAAEARLELAELARAAGDLTTACEHWQIARGLFRELARADDLARTENLMQRHGCPTDWVLTDF